MGPERARRWETAGRVRWERPGGARGRQAGRAPLPQPPISSCQSPATHKERGEVGAQSLSLHTQQTGVGTGGGHQRRERGTLRGRWRLMPGRLPDTVTPHLRPLR